MSIIDINKYKEKLTQKKKITLGVILAIIVIFLTIITIYINNLNFRGWVDNYILRKNIENIDIVHIEINSSNNPNIYAYDKYITILEKNILSMYTSNGNKAFDVDVNISNPIYASNDKYLCIAENKGNNIYLLSSGNVVWQNSIDGTIEKINVNKSGYVSVIEKGSSYKNIVILFSPEGKELFKTYLSSSIAISVDVSDNNEYLAIAEVDTNGAIIQSNIKIISIQKAKSDSTNSVEYNIQGNEGDLITNIKYQDKEKLICIYDNSIHAIQNGQDTEILKFEDKTIMTEIKNKNNIVYAVEKSSGIFSTSTNIIIKNVNNNNEITYEVDSTVKALQVYNTNIVINTGSEAEFINTSGWLQKKYKSNQEIPDIVLGDTIAGIVYRDRIDVIDL